MLNGLIIIPARNEEKTIGAVVSGAVKECAKWKALANIQVLVVDDASTDMTSAYARCAGAKVFRHKHHAGYFRSLQFELLDNCWRDFIITMDADGQHDVNDLAKLFDYYLLQEWHGADKSLSVVLSRPYGPETFLRRTVSRFFSWLICRLTGKELSDPTSGFILFGKQAIVELAKHYPTCNSNISVFYYLLRKGLHINEIPVTMQHRRYGRSMYSNIKVALFPFKVLDELYKIWRMTK